MIRIEVDVVWTKIFGLNEYKEIKEKIVEELRFHPEGYFFSEKYQNKIVEKNIMLKEDVQLPNGKIMRKGEIPEETVREWDGYINLLMDKGYMSLCLSGLVPRLIKILKNNNINYNIKKIYNNDNIIIKDIPLNGMELRDYQKEQVDICKKKKRGIIHAATGAGKCFAKGTKILMYDGNIKNVEDIKINDIIMGADSKSRKVLNITSGKEMMYDIIPVKGEKYTVNKSHILSLRITGGSHNNKYPKNYICDISVKDYLKQCNYFKHCAKGYRTGVEFKKQKLSKYLPPYLLGLWLGDGYNKWPRITNMDKKIEIYLKKFVKKIKAKLHTYIYKRLNNKAKDYIIKFSNMGDIGYGRGIKTNLVKNELGRLNLLGNKYIPNEYKINSREVRLQILAGLIDSDGYYKNGYLQIITKFDKLKDDILYLARSLGFAAYVKKVIKGIKSTGFKGEYWNISISGYLEQIPTLLKRKQAKPRKQIKNVLNTGIKVKPIGVKEYYGFTINGDKHFLLSDFTVVHNTEIMIKLSADIQLKTLIIVNRITLFRQTIQKFKNRLNLKENEINVISGDLKYYNPANRITIATFQSLFVEGKKGKKIILKHEEVLRDADMIIGDEIHHVSQNELGTILKYCKNAKVRFGFSATPFRCDGYDMMLEAHIGNIIHHVGISELIKRGYLSKPKIYMVKAPYFLDKPLTYKNAYKHFMKCEEKNKMVADIAYKFGKIGKSVLLSFTRVEHLKIVYKILKKMNTAGLTIKKIIGANTADQKEEAMDKLNTKEYNIILSTLFGEGADIPTLDILCNVRNSKSPIDVIQQTGRALRISKDKRPIIIDFMDYNTFNGTKDLFENIFRESNQKNEEDVDVKDYFRSYARSRLKFYKSEEEFIVKEINNINEIEEINLK